MNCIAAGYTVTTGLPPSTPSHSHTHTHTHILTYTHTVYGVELTTLVKLHGTKVPVVVKDCIEEIESRGEESQQWVFVGA